MTRDLTSDTDLAIVAAELAHTADRGSMSHSDGGDLTVDGVLPVHVFLKPLLAAAWERGYLDAVPDPGKRDLLLSQRLAGDGRPNPFGVAWRDRTAENLAAQAREWVQLHEDSVRGADDGVIVLLERMAAELDR